MILIYTKLLLTFSVWREMYTALLTGQSLVIVIHTERVFLTLALLSSAAGLHWCEL